ncbi:MAG TPA: non-homologous end-joining DNA ligase, partial [Polyangiaceae bacterium]
GELVALEADGRSDFQLLQHALGEDDSETIYYAFDLLFLDGEDLRDRPLLERKARLEKLLKARKNAVIRYSPHTIGNGEAAFRSAGKMKLEGIVSKRVESTYVGKRSSDWLKTKCTGRQEFVVGGWTDPRGARAAIGALLVGTFAKGELVYAGKVGTGFSEASLKALHVKLGRIETKTSPFVDPPVGAKAKGVHWTKPVLVAEINFTEMTRSGRIRHPTFRGLRTDKPAKDVVLEKPKR